VLLDGARDVPLRLGVEICGLDGQDGPLLVSSATEPPTNTTS
jgi:hypothetical protein